MYTLSTENKVFSPPKSVVASVDILTVVKNPLIPLIALPNIISPGAAIELFNRFETYLFSFKTKPA